MRKNEKEVINCLAEIINIPKEILSKNKKEYVSKLGLNSLSLTKLKGVIDEDISYSNLLGMTVQQVIKKSENVNHDERLMEEKIDGIDNLFPLTPMQESYMIGTFQNDPCQIYNEFDIKGLDVVKFNETLNKIDEMFPNMDSIIVKDKYQKRGVNKSRYFNISETIEQTEDLDKRRETIIALFKSDKDIYWDVKVTLVSKDVVRVHMIVDMMFCDATSLMFIINEFISLYNNSLGGNMISLNTYNFYEFEKYCKDIKNPSKDSIKYWEQYCETIYPAPKLPQNDVNLHSEVVFKRESKIILKEKWIKYKTIGENNGLTANTLLLAAFSKTLKIYSEDDRFTIAVTTSNRSGSIHRESGVAIGEFTDVMLIPLDTEKIGIIDLAKEINDKVLKNREHNDLSGIEFIRMLRKNESNNSYVFPIVFTSFLGIIQDLNYLENTEVELVYQQNQTPQVDIDFQVYEYEGNLNINIDYNSNIYDTEMINEFLNKFYTIINYTIKDEVELGGVLNLREKINNTKYDFENSNLLHNMFLDNIDMNSDRYAIVDNKGKVTYNDIKIKSKILAKKLIDKGISAEDKVAILIDKSYEQSVAALATLMAGAAFIPLNVKDTYSRIEKILDDVDCKYIITEKEIEFQYTKMTLISPKITSERYEKIDLNLIEINPKQTAYCIFTSGTTGKPKCVEISHESAVNTCLDINKKFIKEEYPTVYGISEFHFDLSIWDIFGTFSLGGTLILPSSDDIKTPQVWWDNIEKHSIRVWNSVPTIIEMLLEAYEPKYHPLLKIILLSGEKISIELVNKIKKIFFDVNVIALGGATEASIWSNYHVVSENTANLGSKFMVPYGKPLANQQIYVLDSKLNYRPEGVVGDIYIGGKGVAKGYLLNEEMTKESFVNTKQYGRVYKTGDLGRYLNNGEIEILGRKDRQVKIGGYRIELIEIEQCVEEIEGVDKASVISMKGYNGILIGFVKVSDKSIKKKNIEIHLKKNLPLYMCPIDWHSIDNIPLTKNGKLDEEKLVDIHLSNISNQIQREGNKLDDQTEIKNIAAHIMGIPALKINESKSLFKQGLTSLMTIQMVRELENKWGVEVPSTLLFNYPSVEKIIEYKIEMNIGEVPVKINESDDSEYADPIAIVGVSFRLPGDVTNMNELWEMLNYKHNNFENVPEKRFNIDEIYDADNSKKNATYTKKGSFIKGIDKFDYNFFDISYNEAMIMDPQQRLMLEVAFEAFVMSKYKKEDLLGKRMGVFIGQMNYDWLLTSKYNKEYAGTGSAPSITSNRISNIFDLRGPSMTIDTACSSSLVAFDTAVMNINSGKCDEALVGGVNLILDPIPYITTSKANMLSKKGFCTPFDSRADGIVRGEGIGAIVLKRLSKAQEDGNHILATVRGSAVNQDGYSASLTAPNGIAQEDLISSVIRSSNINTEDIKYIECHGTGTPLGDPIEVEAINNTIGKNRTTPLYLGTIKGNIGHLEGAAGIAGLIKALLVLNKKMVPANVNYKQMNPKIQLDNELVKIPKGIKKIDSTNESGTILASISSFGYGGTNAHVVLESWDKSDEELEKYNIYNEQIYNLYNSKYIENSMPMNKSIIRNFEIVHGQRENDRNNLIIEEVEERTNQEWSIEKIRKIINKELEKFISKEKINEHLNFIDMGLTSLDLVQFRQNILEKIPNNVEIPVHFAFNYPSIKDVEKYILIQINGDDLNCENDSKQVWNKFSEKSGDKRIFLIGGVVGNNEETFGRLNKELKYEILSHMPIVPSNIKSDNINIESMAMELKEEMYTKYNQDSYVIGGLSFGATIAIELAIELEKDDRLNKLILLDPRHVPPFSPQIIFESFEKVLEQYTPSNIIKSQTYVLTAEIPENENQTDIMAEASRNFQEDGIVYENLNKMIKNIHIKKISGHHFNILYRYAKQTALEIERIMDNENMNEEISRENKMIRNDSKQRGEQEEVAIIGSACRLPGEVTNVDKLWEMLINKTDCVTEIPLTRFDISEFYNPDSFNIGDTYTNKGAFIKDIEYFDYNFFNISYLEAMMMDPQQRQLLEVIYESFQNAGYTKEDIRGTNTGVYVGVANDDWRTMKRTSDIQNPYFGVGVSSSIVANRISYTLGLNGPSIAIDTACSSSLVALDLAVEKIRSGKCETAVIGGVNLMLHERSFVGACAANMLSRIGRCATFDEEADGYCRGEGVGAVILKKLSDAERDGDQILAIVKSSAVNQDGRSASLTAPNGKAQEAVILEALDEAGLEGKDIDYVECHGTGTPLGDPIEVEALKNVLNIDRIKPVTLGSIKSNIGHLEGAAGVIGLIKSIEVVRRGIAPGNIHLNKLNSNIDINDFNVNISNETVNLKKLNVMNEPLRGAVSSFGFGGTNAHVILEEYIGKGRDEK